METGHVEKRSKRGWTVVIDYGRTVDLATHKERQHREYHTMKHCTKAVASTWLL